MANNITKTISITSDIGWKILSDDWIICTPNIYRPVTESSDIVTTEVEILIAENTSTEFRSGTINIYDLSGNFYDSCIVYQNGVGKHLDIEPMTFSFDCESHNNNQFTINSNINWSLDTDSNWIILNKSSGLGDDEITFNVESNLNSSDRHGTITVSGSSVNKTINISQSGNNTPAPGNFLERTLDNISYNLLQNKSVGINVINPADVQLSWSISGDGAAAWLDPHPFFFVDGFTFYLKYSAQKNETSENRTGNITVTYNGKSETLKVVQSFLDLETNVNLVEKPKASSTGNQINVYTNASSAWTAVSDSEWLQLTTNQGTGETGKIIYDISANETVNRRTATITITKSSNNSTNTTIKNVQVIQDGKDDSITLGYTFAEYSKYEQTNKTLGVTAVNITTWKATTSNSWIHITSDSGTIQYNLDENNGSLREGMITVKGGGITKTCTIRQKATAS